MNQEDVAHIRNGILAIKRNEFDSVLVSWKEPTELQGVKSEK